MKLKTLKDIQVDGMNITEKKDIVEVTINPDGALRVALKQEAIKYLKYYEKEIKLLSESQSKMFDKLMAKIYFITHFFNITEEELK